jgi:hypothetical protein
LTRYSEDIPSPDLKYKAFIAPPRWGKQKQCNNIMKFLTFFFVLQTIPPDIDPKIYKTPTLKDAMNLKRKRDAEADANNKQERQQESSSSSSSLPSKRIKLLN